MRRHDWPERLEAYVDSRRLEPFAFGTHDCCQFAAGAVEAITGENPADRFHYADETEAAQLLELHGGVEGIVTVALGSPVHPSQGGRGDVVVAELANGDTAGVLLGNTCAFPSEFGIVYWPRSVARLAWRVR
jgi:hypothetical protein